MKVIIAWDGDHIGREVGRASLADDVEGLRRISQAIDRGNEIWRSWVLANGGSVISAGGDEGRAEIPAEHLSELPRIRDQYASAVSAPVSVGVGTKLSEADKALIAAKLRGGNQIVLFTEDVAAEVEKATNKNRSEADKLSEEYLQKASPAPTAQPTLAQGAGGAGMTGAAAPSQPSIQAPVMEGSEHSEGEAAQAMADGQPPGPEMTHAAQDMEQNFHDLAGQSQQQANHPEVPGKNSDAIKLQVVKVLQLLRAQTPILEQIKQSSPETYQAVMAMAQAVIAMAKEMNGDGQHTSLAQIDAGAKSNAQVVVQQPPEEGEGGEKKEEKSDTKKSEEESPEVTEPEDWVECDESGHTYGTAEAKDHCLVCGGHRERLEQEALDKAALSTNGKPPAAHHHLNLPVGSKIDPGAMGTRDTGQIKVLHPESGKQGWIQARAGEVMSQDGHAISSRNPGGK